MYWVSVDACDGFVSGGMVRYVLISFWRLIHERFVVGLTAVVAFVRFAIRVGSVLFCDVGVVQFWSPSGCFCRLVLCNFSSIFSVCVQVLFILNRFLLGFVERCREICTLNWIGRSVSVPEFVLQMRPIRIEP